ATALSDTGRLRLKLTALSTGAVTKSDASTRTAGQPLDLSSQPLLLLVPVFDGRCDFPIGSREGVLGLEHLAIGRHLRFRGAHLFPLGLEDRSRVTTVDLSDPHRLARW